MSQPGRNEPCHCGSGKKYKKCCLEIDAAATIRVRYEIQKEDEWDPEEDELIFRNNKYEEADYYEDEDDVNAAPSEDDDEDANNEYLSNELDSSQEGILNKPYPAISPEEEKLVDDWWEDLSYEEEPKVIKKHIEAFMLINPQLVENLGLENEVIFELGAEYTKRGEVNEYINFLFYFRKEFPGAYRRSGGYYDLDIIAWLIANKREGEIENYLDILKDYPVDFFDKLLELSKLLEATDNIEPLISLIKATFERTISSDKLFGGDKILSPLVSLTMSFYLKKKIEDIDINDFMNDLEKAISPFPLDKEDSTLNYWKETFNEILQPYSKWPTEIPKKKSQIEDRYKSISNNFSRYLHETTGISWVSSLYYSHLITLFFRENIQSGNGRIKKQFDFTEKNIDRIVGSLSKNMLWMDCTKSLGLLQAIYHFAGYLQECENINEQEKLTIQNDCTTLYHVIYPTLKINSIEAGCFKTFPFF